jgi:predicted nucleotidyltransferase
MDKTATNALTKYIDRLKKEISVDKVVVFGSRSDGKPDKSSDVDVVIVSKSFGTMSMEQRLDLLYLQSAFIEPEIHPWGYTAEEIKTLHPQSTIGMAVNNGTLLNLN